MIVKVHFSALTRTKWWEYAIRFCTGGVITAGAGLLAKKFGPSFGGLFLAFPAILAASVTLVAKHEREKKEQKGLNGTHRGRQAGAADAAGAVMGSLGLIAFAVFAWKLLPGYSAWIAIGGATLLWAAVSAAIWWLWKRNHVIADIARHRTSSPSSEKRAL